MLIDEMLDCLAALSSEIDELFNPRATEITAGKKKSLKEALTMALEYLNEI
jgi:hypothetical protein